MPTIQVRDMAVQKRENDLVLGTFGRGFYVLDDYSPLRDITPQTLAEEARLFPLRDAYLFSPIGLAPAGTAGIGAMAGNWTSPNPPFGAVFTYNVKQPLPDDAKLVLTIADENGRQVRRLDVDKIAGPAPRRVEPAQRSPRAPTAAAGRRRRRIRRARRSAAGPARRRPDVIARRSANWSANRDADRSAANVLSRAANAMMAARASFILSSSTRLSMLRRLIRLSLPLVMVPLLVTTVFPQGGQPPPPPPRSTSRPTRC